jgi:predicted nuclease with TOPRIM domain
MDVQDYCNNVTIELTGWKAKVYDVVRKLDKMSTGDKEKVVPEANELHIILEELSDRIEKLKKECPTSWSPERKEIEDKTGYLRAKLDKVWDKISPSDIGG